MLDDNDETIKRIFRLADRIDSRSPDLDGITTRELVEDWVSHNESLLEIEMLSDRVLDNDVYISREDFNDFVSILEAQNSERDVALYLESLVRL